MSLLTCEQAQDAGLTAMQQRAFTDCDLDPASFADGASLAALGIRRAVVNGGPNAAALTLAPSGASPLAARFVVDQAGASDPARLAKLHEEGVRAVRFILPAAEQGIKRGLDAMSRVADHLAPLGWHVELGLSAETRGLARCEWSLTCLPVALCLTDVAAFARGRDADDPDLAFALELLLMGRTWLKLSGPLLGSPTTTLAGFVEAALALRRDRIVWGSGAAAAGDRGTAVAGALVALEALIPDSADRAAVLVDNPQRLYGFTA